ncbi:GNAT superfamily N-acetyltransferase [Rhizobium sp. BK181]|uniref:GNAT family N-acetyltransferase n=1 Tax=Rhizobium sp. BK181 TaxID=2587072 RepID=UPI00160E2669|nr:GNAT family N-acetyltransferase [Rhizobium sp. BK181]MBB3315265.1 GNAT superfamily N-acetyltransferase [Rhizobium sp. BK181]
MTDLSVQTQPQSVKWTIRSPRESDLETLADIYLAVRRETFAWVDPASFRHDDFKAHTQGEHLWLAEAPNGEIAGFMTLWPPDDFIHMLYVSKSWQGQGAGAALLAVLPDWPHNKYRLKCLVKNSRAKAFYCSKGFVVTGSGTSAEGDYEEMSFYPDA